MEIVLLLIQIPLLIVIIRYIRKLHTNSLLINSYYYILSFKVTAGFMLGIIYFNYYKNGDTINYGKDLDFLSGIFYSDFKSYLELILTGKTASEVKTGLINYRDIRAFAFVRMISPFYIISGSNYWICSIYLSLFSFSGLWILSNKLFKIYKVKPLALLISFFLFPSVIFWSSGMIKESIAIGMIGFISSIILDLANRQNNFTIVKFFLLLLFSYCLFILKYYYFAVLFAIIVPYGLIKYLSLRIDLFATNKRYRISALILLILLLVFMASFFHPLLHFDKISEALYLNYTKSLNKSTIYNSYTFSGLTSDPKSFLCHLPQAIIYGLFGPFLWQTYKLITTLNGIENTILLILFVTFILNSIKTKEINKTDIEETSIVIYIFILAVFMAFASPNWGSLVRYKIGYLPFFLLLILNSNPIIFQLEKRFSFLNLSEKKS